MQLKDQVCTLEQAKCLKELGVMQDSLFSWCGDESPRLMDNGEGPATVGPWLFVDLTKPVNNQHADYRDDVPSAKPFAAAFTVAELGQMMNSEVQTFRTGSELSQYANWEWCDHNNQAAYGPYETEAQARSAYLIFMLERGFLTADEINKRLTS